MKIMKLKEGRGLKNRILTGLLSILPLIGAAALVSCGEKPDVEANLVISSEEVSAAAEGGELTVQIISDQKWSITSIDQQWIDASILAGVPGVEVNVKFSYEPNPTSSARTAHVSVVSGATKGTITVTQQAGFDPATVDVSKIYVPEEMRTMDLFKSSSKWYDRRS